MNAIRTPLFLVVLQLLTLAARGANAPAVMEPFEVTGTRIKQVALDPAVPLIRFSSPEIDASGHPLLGDFLQSLPWNVGLLNTPANAVSLSAAQTAVNLRGLGSNNTLLLINGRRTALFGQPESNTLSADVGNLPAAAVESVEVLLESASAQYGSDAVAGVVNVKLRKSFSGATIRTGYRQFFDTDWSHRSANLIFGSARGRFSLLGVVDFAASNDVRFSDRPVSRTEDLRAIGGRDGRQGYGWPGQLYIPEETTSAPSAARGGLATIGTVSNGIVTIGAPTRTPRAADFVRLPVNLTNGRPTPGDSQNNFDRAPYTTLLPGERAHGVFVSLEQRVFPQLAAFAELGWRRRVLSTYLHPTPASTSLESAPGVGDGPGGAIVFPRTNPYNPFGVDFFSLQFHLVELGPRIREFTNEAPRALAGLRGKIGDRWSWEAAALYSHNSVAENTRNYITDVDLQAGLAGRLGGFINPFGPSDPGVIDRARTSLHAKQKFRQSLADLHASGELLRLPAGPLQVAFGAEVRQDDYFGEPSELAARGAYVAWSALTRQNADRDIRAIFGECALPLACNVQAQVAARSEDYSDFGHTTKPTFALTWQPSRWASLRASRSQSFKAPELLDLYASQTEAYAVADDPRRSDLGSYAMRYRVGGNPRLRPEAGVAWQLGGAFRIPQIQHFEFDAGWWRIVKTDMVGSLGLPFLLAHELDPVFPTAERIQRAPAPSPERPGEIVLVNDTRGNIDQVTVSGWDFGAQWRFSSHFAGDFRVSAHASWLRQQKFMNRTGGSRDRVGTSTIPEWRGRGSVSWRRGKWSTSLSTDWIGHHDGDGVNYLGGAATQHARAFAHCHLARDFPHRLRLSLGLTNLFDSNPPVNFAAQRGYATGLYDNLGRSYLVTLERSF